MAWNQERCGCLIYFDTNVFDPHHGLPAAREHLVLGAIGSQRCRLVFDLDCFLEALLALRKIGADATPKARRQVERMLKWCDLRRIVTSADTLLAQAILSYSRGDARVREFVDKGQLEEQIDEGLRHWDSASSPQSRLWRSIIDDTQRDRDRYQKTISELLQKLGPRDGFRQGTSLPSFLDFWCEQRERVARTFVELVGNDRNQRDLWRLCAERGIAGLLDIRAVRLSVVTTVSLMYSQFYNEGKQIPRPKKSDAADLRHAIAASTAEVFVTNDHGLHNRLSAVPMEDKFRVFLLDTFLADLEKGSTLTGTAPHRRCQVPFERRVG